jgi:hypothetical protein
LLVLPAEPPYVPATEIVRHFRIDGEVHDSGWWDSGPARGELMGEAVIWPVSVGDNRYAVKVFHVKGPEFHDPEGIAERINTTTGPLERRFFEAGVPMPEPVPLRDGSGYATVLWSAEGDRVAVRVYPWIESEPLNLPVDPGWARAAGEALGRMHALDLPAEGELNTDHMPPSTPGPQGWRRVHADVAQFDPNLASTLKKVMPDLEDAEDFFARHQCRVLTSHGDIDEPLANMLNTAGGPVLIDFAAVPVAREKELQAVALGVAQDPRQEPDPELVTAFIEGYKSAGVDLESVADVLYADAIGQALHTSMSAVVEAVRSHEGKQPEDRKRQSSVDAADSLLNLRDLVQGRSVPYTSAPVLDALRQLAPESSVLSAGRPGGDALVAAHGKRQRPDTDGGLGPVGVQPPNPITPAGGTCGASPSKRAGEGPGRQHAGDDLDLTGPPGGPPSNDLVGALSGGASVEELDVTLLGLGPRDPESSAIRPEGGSDAAAVAEELDRLVTAAKQQQLGRIDRHGITPSAI